MINLTNPIEVIQHSSKRKNKNPSASFLGIKNPRKALQNAHLYLSLINNFMDSKKSNESKLLSFDFPTDLQMEIGLSNFLIRIRGRKGQLDFCAITEDGRIIDTEFLWNYESKRYLSHNYYMRHCDRRYYLSHLRDDLVEINIDIKLVYVVLTSPKLEKAFVFTIDQINNIKIDGPSGLENCEEFKDSVDLYYERMSKVKNPCPNCGNEWNDNFCRACGHPH